MYTEVSVFDETVEITLFNKRKYWVADTFELNASRMRPVNRVFGTGAGLNLLHEDMVESDCMSSIRDGIKPRLRSPTSPNVKASAQ